jgi:transcription elongation factor GreB
LSKAFTKDDAGGEPVIVPRRAPLPTGVTNYVTTRGIDALRAELLQLQLDRAALPEPDRAHALLVVNGRIRELEERIGSAVLVDPGAQPRDEVRFGARVTVRGELGTERTYEIVGVDEADIAEGRVAFVAPVARALLGRRVGDAVILRTPRGEEELEVVAIA